MPIASIMTSGLGLFMKYLFNREGIILDGQFSQACP